jgi:hypothetical protein
MYYLCSFIIAAYTSDIEDSTKVLGEELNIVGSAKSGPVGSKIIGSFKSSGSSTASNNLV